MSARAEALRGLMGSMRKMAQEHRDEPDLEIEFDLDKPDEQVSHDDTRSLREEDARLEKHEARDPEFEEQHEQQESQTEGENVEFYHDWPGDKPEDVQDPAKSEHRSSFGKDTVPHLGQRAESLNLQDGKMGEPEGEEREGGEKGGEPEWYKLHRAPAVSREPEEPEFWKRHREASRR